MKLISLQAALTALGAILLLSGCGAGRYDNTPKPNVVLTQADHKIPIYPGATQIIGERSGKKIKAIYETKARYEEVVTFYQQKLPVSMKFNTFDYGALARGATASSMQGQTLTAFQLEYQPTNQYTHIIIEKGPVGEILSPTAPKAGPGGTNAPTRNPTGL